MLTVSKKDFPKDLNPLGLKRGDRVEIEIGDATPDFITLDPATIKLKAMRDVTEPREPIVKMPKPKSQNMATMPLPDLKAQLTHPAPAPAAAPVPPMPPMK